MGGRANRPAQERGDSRRTTCRSSSVGATTTAPSRRTPARRPSNACRVRSPGRTEESPGRLYPIGFALSRVISRSTWENHDESVGYLDTRTTNVWRPFRAVDGTVIDAHTDPTFNPSVVGGNFWQNPYFDIVTTNEIAGGVTARERHWRRTHPSPHRGPIDRAGVRSARAESRRCLTCGSQVLAGHRPERRTDRRERGHTVRRQRRSGRCRDVSGRAERLGEPHRDAARVLARRQPVSPR